MLERRTGLRLPGEPGKHRNLVVGGFAAVEPGPAAAAAAVPAAALVPLQPELPWPPAPRAQLGPPGPAATLPLRRRPGLRPAGQQRGTPPVPSKVAPARAQQPLSREERLSEPSLSVRSWERRIRELCRRGRRQTARQPERPSGTPLETEPKARRPVEWAPAQEMGASASKPRQPSRRRQPARKAPMAGVFFRDASFEAEALPASLSESNDAWAARWDVGVSTFASPASATGMFLQTRMCFW